MNIEHVIEAIEQAFSSVTLGNGIGLFEAQAIDDYESVVIQKEQRIKDEKNNWHLISCENLENCHSSLSFFDANGMRFHLPAYINGSLKSDVWDPIFHLTQLDDLAKSKLISLNVEQIKAIIGYLNWCLFDDEYKDAHNDIIKALTEYWNKRAQFE